MTRLLIPIVMMILGLAGGVLAGFLLGGAEQISGEDAPAPAATDHGSEMADPDPATPPSSSDHEYVRLDNQFIVPVVRHGTVRSLVVLSLTVEMRPGQTDMVFEREPRLRDALLRVLFAHANAGGFDGHFTASAAMAPLREGLREAAVGVLGDAARDVLIVDIVRQDT